MLNHYKTVYFRFDGGGGGGGGGCPRRGYGEQDISSPYDNATLL